VQTQGPARAREDAALIGSEELAEGLMLVRASTLKMIRLQLAMERQDRRVALEEVDDLLAIDRRLQNYLDEVPAVQGALMRELEGERAALNREKLTLAAEVIRRESQAPEPEPHVEEAPAFVALDAPAAEFWGSFEFAEADAERRQRGIRRFTVALILLSVLAAAAYLLTNPEVAASLAAGMGVLQ
jgi:hypothetical protein